MDVIEKIGAFAGLASFFGLALIAFLQFMQARHVRDLEDKATFVPEGLDLPTSTTPAKKGKPAKVGASGAAAATGKEAEQEQAPETAAAQTKEAARQVEIARAAAERRQRFEQRRRPGAPSAPGTRPATTTGRSGPEPRAMIVIGLGVAVLVAGVIFATGILGGSNSSSDGGGSANGTAAAAPTDVAVLNSTAVPALAAKIGQEDVRPAGYKLGFVGNTDTPFTITTVMFDPADPANQATAKEIAAKLQISKIEPMSGDIKKAIKGEPVVVVVGEDRAGT